jgi:hypothetical protein
MPDQANPAQGNPNSMPQIGAAAKFRAGGPAPTAIGTVRSTEAEAGEPLADRNQPGFSLGTRVYLTPK